MGILEDILRKLFPLFYFRYGIPIIWRTTSLFHSLKKIKPGELQLETEIRKLSIEIKNLNENEYGLWPSRYQSRTPKRMSNYRPMTRGYLDFGKVDYILKLRVYLNWSIIPFLLLWFGLVLNSGSLSFRILFTMFGAIIVYITYHFEHSVALAT
ncbi:MAG: hypothetical protein FVQ83_10890 [Chloroflexi bacterium]|nr:hypothetical protein [Chloroflexota bacterium]